MHTTAKLHPWKLLLTCRNQPILGVFSGKMALVRASAFEAGGLGMSKVSLTWSLGPRAQRHGGPSRGSGEIVTVLPHSPYTIGSVGVPVKGSFKGSC